MRFALLLLMLLLPLPFALGCTAPMSDSVLKATVEERVLGDRTGVCVLAAVVETEAVSRAVVCADASRARPLDTKTALEIGSVSKTMTAALLASLIEDGMLTLDEPLATHLPAGTRVPDFEGAPIRLKHLVTHTSGLPGLPARFPTVAPDDPYAALTAEALLESLGDVRLTQAPGTHWAYSNFGAMLLSYVVARAAHQDLEALLQERLFSALEMSSAFVSSPPPGVQVAQGHLSLGTAASPWHFLVDLAGVGGVKASLDDLVRYVEAQLGRRGDARLAAVLATTHAAVDLGSAGAAPSAGEPEMGMGWIRLRLNGRLIIGHDGGTGGFSSFVAIDLERRRAVVLLMDTALSNLGGLADLGAHLIEPSFPLEAPRTLATPSPELLASLVGRYQLEGGPEVTLTTRDGALFATPEGQAELELGFDSHGDFFPLTIEGLLTPAAPGGEPRFIWTQGGVSVPATRLTP